MTLRFSLRPFAAAMVTSALLTGCSALSALNGAASPLDAYDLTAPGAPIVARSTSARQFVVELPTTTGALNNDRILIRPHPLQAAYLPDGKWAEDVPVMLQTLLVRSFEDTNAFRYVGRRPLGTSGDYALVTDLTDFQAEAAADGKTASIRLRLTARLVREDDAAILSTRSFTSTAQVASTKTLDLVEGFNTANQSMLSDVTNWGLKTLGITTRR
jgi:cholesterol transport system auxiliary component